MKSKSEWVHWGRKNQIDPVTHKFIPDENQPESYTGLEEIITEIHQTKIPRLPWGSQKALIVTLTTNSYPLLESISEKDCVQKILSKAGFSVNEINADENDDPNILRAKLASNHWDIIHFIGHLKVDEKHFIGHSGGLKAADFVASCCRAGPPRLVILNACRSGDQSVETDTSGLSGPIAEQFCHRGVDCVIGTRWDIWDKAATEFSRFFWEHITQGLGPFGMENEVRFEVESALLKTRLKLKEKFPTRDACWLAYMLFTSRKDGCVIPPQELVIPQFVPDMTHPAYIDIHNHTQICEHLAPGGSGLYLMSAPACTGKTTVSILALQTLGFSKQEIESSYISLRHDESLETIDRLHSIVKSIDSAPLFPLIIDDSERVAAYFGSGIEDKILRISKYFPVLLISRENHADQGLQYLPFWLKDHDSDEIIRLNPHLPTPRTLQSYLEQFNCRLTMKESFSLLSRMNQTFLGMPRFYESVLSKQPNVDLLEPKNGYQIRTRIQTLSDDELFLLQILSGLYQPVVCKLRLLYAWELLKRNKIIASKGDVATTLCRLDLLSEYMRLEDLPSEDSIDEDFLAKIPANLKNISLEKTNWDKIYKMYPDQRTSDYIPWKGVLFGGYTVRNEVIDIVRTLGPPHSETIGLRAFLEAFSAFKCPEDMPRMQDGFDHKEVLLKAFQPESSKDAEMTSNSLLFELSLGANSKRNTLDEALQKWFSNPDKLVQSISQNPGKIMIEFTRRLPSLRPVTVEKIGKFVLNHRSIFPIDDPNAALFLWSLALNGESSPNPYFRSVNEWTHIFKIAEESILLNQPERVAYLEGTKLKKRIHRLLYFEPHHKREESLLLAVKQALDHEDEAVENCIILQEVGQVLYRHLLFKESNSGLMAFETSVHRFGELLKTEMENNSSMWKDRIPSFTHRWLWFRIAICLFKHRLELRTRSDTTEELRWIRSLMMAAKQIRQVGPDFCKLLMSEAASRMLNLRQNDSLSWTDELNEVRAKLLREIAQRAYDDISDEEVWIVNELTPHILYGFDFHNPLPHILLEQTLFVPKSDKRAENEHKRIMESVWNQNKDTFRIPDKYVDISPELRFVSASNSLFDRILLPPTAFQTAKVAALLWGSVRNMGDAARPIGSFAGRFPEFLSDELRTAAESFLMRTQQDNIPLNRGENDAEY